MSEQENIYKMLTAEIGKLDELAQKIVSMYYLDKFNALEMAEVLGLDEMKVAKIFEESVELIISNLESNPGLFEDEKKATG